MSEPTLQALSPPRIEIRPDIWLDARLALWLADAQIVVVADLHWGYVASHRIHGNLLPAWGDAEIAARLKSLIKDYQPHEMIWLGDSVHTLGGPDAANSFLNSCSVPITLVSGNHDARWKPAKNRPSVIRGRYFFHHGDRDLRAEPELLEIVGHHHPAVSWYDGAGTSLKLPALIESAQRLVLPAFSPWAAGVSWNMRGAGETIYAIASKRIFTVPPTREQKAP